MPHVYAHDAVLTLDQGGDPAAPGAAITLALCGSWDHQPPCPLAAHHTSTARDGEHLRVRVLFAADPADEPEVRRRIDDTLATGRLSTPDGSSATWQLNESKPSE